MANTATRDSLMTRALDYADMTGSAFPVEARVNDYIDAALAELHYLMCQHDPSYAYNASNITVVSGTESYTLSGLSPSLYKLRAVYVVSGGRRYKVQRLLPDENVGVRNSPLTGGTIEIHYIGEFVPPATDATAIGYPYPPGWEEYVALQAAIKLLVREESDAGGLMRLRDELFSRMMGWLSNRDLNAPERVVDVYGRYPIERGVLLDDVPAYRYALEGNTLKIVEVATGEV